VVIAVLGGSGVASGALSLGDVQAFIQYSRQFTMPITQVASQMNLLQSGVPRRTVFALLDAEEEEPDCPSGTAPRPGRRVDLEHVASSTSRAGTDQRLQPFGLTGSDRRDRRPTGAGKTTIVNLLMRFYEIDSGSVLLDGIDAPQPRP